METAALTVALASPGFLPVLVSFPSFVTYKTFVILAPEPTLTTSVARPALALRVYSSASFVLRANSPNCRSATCGTLLGTADRLILNGVAIYSHSVCTKNCSIYCYSLFIQLALFLLGRYANKLAGFSGFIQSLILSYL